MKKYVKCACGNSRLQILRPKNGQAETVVAECMRCSARFEIKGDDSAQGELAQLRQAIAGLKDQLERAAAQTYCTLCGRTLDQYEGT